VKLDNRKLLIINVQSTLQYYNIGYKTSSKVLLSFNVPLNYYQ